MPQTWPHYPTDMTPLFPVCAVCQRKVEKMRWFEHPARMSKIVVAECHGETDRSELTWHDLMEGLGSLRPGQAFTTKRIGDVQE